MEHRLKVHEKDHREVKSLAAKMGKSIADFVHELVTAYKTQTRRQA